MLDAPEIAKRLCAAMDLRYPRLTSMELARKAGVSKQAVYEWRTTGRIAKAHFFAIAEATETPLEFWFEPERGSSKATRSIWARIGKAFARAAVLALVALLPFLLAPQAADAAVFRIAESNCVLCQIAKYLLRLGKAVFCDCRHYFNYFRTV